MSQNAPAGIDGPVTGGALAIALYGLTVVLGIAVFDADWLPHSTAMVAVLMVVLMAAGASVGAGVDRARAR